MNALGATLSMFALFATALVAAPMAFLTYAAADPEGIVDGLLRMTWFMPGLWLLGLWLESDRRLARTRGQLKVHLPMLLVLTTASTLLFGWRHEGKVITSGADPAARTERVPTAGDGPTWIEADFGLVSGLGRWAHANLPPHPLPEGGG